MRRGQVAGSRGAGLDLRIFRTSSTTRGRLPGGQHWPPEGCRRRSSRSPPAAGAAVVRSVAGCRFGFRTERGVLAAACWGSARPRPRPLGLGQPWRHGGAQDCPSVVRGAGFGGAAQGEFRRGQAPRPRVAGASWGRKPPTLAARSGLWWAQVLKRVAPRRGAPGRVPGRSQVPGPRGWCLVCVVQGTWRSGR